MEMLIFHLFKLVFGSQNAGVRSEMLIFHWFWHANVNISLVSDGFVNTHVDIPLVLERIT